MISKTVRAKAVVAGAHRWLDELPGLVAGLERDWEMTVGAVYPDATEAFVARVTLADGTPAVLKLLIPRPGEAVRNELTVLRLADGEGCVRLLRHDEGTGAMLLERLGRSMHDLGLPIGRRHEILCDAAARIWRPAPGCGLPTGAQKGRWLIDFIVRTWESTGRPCAERTVAHALACAERRIAGHDDERAVLVHGDVHEWNILESGHLGSGHLGSGHLGSGELGSGDGFKLVDPDGLLADAEYDLGVMMREDPVELMRGDPWDRARWLAARTGLDAVLIWEWGVVERVSTGLLCTEIGLQPVGREMLSAADRIAVTG